MAKHMKDAVLGALQSKASDIHISVGRPVQFRCSGELVYWNDDVLGTAEVQSYVDELLDARVRAIQDRDGEADFAYSFDGIARLRCNVYRERGNLAMALRLLPIEMPTIEEVTTPLAIVKAATKKRGLILVTGPTGSGKSTTLAALINYLNHNFKKHILKSHTKHSKDQKKCSCV